MSSIDDKLTNLEKQVIKNKQDIEKLKTLKKMFPDLTISINRWKVERFSSASVNDKVNDYEWRHNCGCCYDSPVEVWPFIKTHYGNVYSNPAYFVIGEADVRGNGDNPYPNWEAQLRKTGIPEFLIERMLEQFKKDKEEDNIDNDDI